MVTQQVTIFAFSRVGMVDVLSVQVLGYLLGPFILVQTIVCCRVRSSVRVALLYLNGRLVGLLRDARLFDCHVMVECIVTLVRG